MALPRAELHCSVIFAILLMAGRAHTRATTSEALMKQMRQLLNKPTNSVTIRQQNVGDICKNHPFGEFVANTDNCRQFYMCQDNNEAVAVTCPNTMYFNPIGKMCDVAANVPCAKAFDTTLLMGGNDIMSPTDGNSAVLNAQVYCASTRQQTNQIMLIGSSVNCQQYYICYYGQAVLQECSEDLHWNAFIGKCDVKANAACTITENGAAQSKPHTISSSDTATATATTAAGELSWPLVGTSPLVSSLANDHLQCPSYGEHTFPHAQHCGFYIYCLRGTAVLQQCPFFNYYDIATKSCQWRTKATCIRDMHKTIAIV